MRRRRRRRRRRRWRRRGRRRRRGTIRQHAAFAAAADMAPRIIPAPDYSQPVELLGDVEPPPYAVAVGTDE